jgi:hypothetical protein
MPYGTGEVKNGICANSKSGDNNTWTNFGWGAFTSEMPYYHPWARTSLQFDVT